MSIDLEQVAEIRRAGDLKRARIECGRLLAKQPDDPAIMREMAVIATAEGNWRDAERLLLRIAEVDAASLRPATDLAAFYAGRGDFVQAISWYRRAVEIKPAEPGILYSLAQALLIVGQIEEAASLFDHCLSLNPDDPMARLGRGHARRMLGETELSIQNYRECLRSEEVNAEASWSLASLSPKSFTEAEIADLLIRCRTAADPRLSFALARILEHQGDFEAAWANYVTGNQKQKDILRYDHSVTRQRFKSVLDSYAAEVLGNGAMSTSEGGKPIFIVGMPRSGSTLVEQILASHPLVEGTAELPYLNEIAHALQNRPIAAVSSKRLAELGQQYLSASQFHRPMGKPSFTDKLPDNFFNIGLIQLALPQAVIIDVRRDPVATCVANFRQYYPAGKSFSYDLQDMADTYRRYVELMVHWQTVLPGKVLTIRYEDLVNSPESQIRKILIHCDLEWHDGCLNFHKTPRAVVTASSEQVRQPLYAHSLESWRCYETKLVDLIEAFGAT